MNCQDALDLLYAIIDKEASEIDSQQVKTHLEKCRDCFERYQLEESVQQLINEKIDISKNDGITSDRLENLKSKIIDRLDEVDEHECEGGRTSFFSLPIKIMIAVASLVIFVGAAFLSSGFYKHTVNYEPFEEAHLLAFDNLNNYKNDISNTFSDLQLASNISGYELVGIVPEHICECDMHHAVYEKEGELVSIFIVPDEHYDIPEDILEAKVEHSNLTMYNHDCRSCRLVYTKIGDYIYITALNHNKVDPVEFIPGIAAI